MQNIPDFSVPQIMIYKKNPEKNKEGKYGNIHRTTGIKSKEVRGKTDGL